MTNTVQALDTAITGLIEKTITATETVGGYVAAEAPIVVDQLLKWHFAVSLIVFIAVVAVFTVATLISVKGEKRFGKDRHIVWSHLMFTIPCLCCEGFKWLQIATAPKVYLLEYAAELLKKGS